MSGQKSSIEHYAVGPESRAVLQEAYAASKNYEPGIKEVDGSNTMFVGGKLFLDTAFNRAFSVARNIEAAKQVNLEMSLDSVPPNACNAWLVADSLRDSEKYCTWVCQETGILGQDLTKRIGVAVANDLGITVEEADKASLLYDSLAALKQKQWEDENPDMKGHIVCGNDYSPERVERVVSALPEDEREKIRSFVEDVLNQAGVWAMKSASPDGYENLDRGLYIIDDGSELTEEKIDERVARLPPENRKFVRQFMMDILEQQKKSGGRKK